VPGRHQYNRRRRDEWRHDDYRARDERDGTPSLAVDSVPNLATTASVIVTQEPPDSLRIRGHRGTNSSIGRRGSDGRPTGLSALDRMVSTTGPDVDSGSRREGVESGSTRE